MAFAYTIGENGAVVNAFHKNFREFSRFKASKRTKFRLKIKIQSYPQR